ALQQYEGTYLVVSHDRHFIAQVANKIWWIENAQLKEYPGTYDEYEYWQKQQKSLSVPSSNETKNAAKAVVKNLPIENKELKKIERKITDAERKITQLETDLKSLENELEKPSVYANPSKLAEITLQYEEMKKQLEAATQEWENALLEMEQLNKH
ncbi:MAG: ABC transporter ATP-binding protein, partial [Flammeovirgaceae bacterium]|nr:ABC transporter ATP-binding protein [Flammeovirgaceae bacterium]